MQQSRRIHFRLGHSLAYISSLLFIATSLSCTHEPVKTAASSDAAAGAVAAREPASSAENEARETTFLSMMADEADPKSLRANYLDRILKIYYRAEIYTERFEDDLNRIIALQKKDPNYSENLLDTDEYAKNLQMKALADRAHEDINYIYRRLLDTTVNPDVSEKTRQTAAAIISDMYQWIESRPVEDRLILSELLEELAAIKNSQTTVNNTDLKAKRAVASIDFDFTRFISGAKDLTPVYKAHFSSIHNKGLQALAWHDAEADAPAAKIEWNDRAPNAEEPIAPGIGVWGNITGLSFPQNELVFTFDDGPQYANDVKLVGILQAHRDPINTKGIPTTFFWMVKSVMTSPESIPLAKKNGYTMNNHTWTHPDLMTQNPAQLQHEVTDSNAFLLNAFGFQPALGSAHFRFFRCPYGSCYQNSHAPPAKVARANVIRQKIADMGLVHAYWTIDSNDWKLPHQNQRIFDITTKQILISKRGVILMHDIHDWTIDTAKMIFDWIKDQNENHGAKFRLVNLETAVDEFNHNLKTGASGPFERNRIPLVPTAGPANAIIKPSPLVRPENASQAPFMN